MKYHIDDLEMRSNLAYNKVKLIFSTFPTKQQNRKQNETKAAE